MLRKSISIALVFVFAFIGIRNTLHLTETQQNHYHTSGEHLCVQDAHHYCALCDTILLPGLLVDAYSADITILFSIDRTWGMEHPHLPLVVKNPYGRAPPMAV